MNLLWGKLYRRTHASEFIWGAPREKRDVTRLQRLALVLFRHRNLVELAFQRIADRLRLTADRQAVEAAQPCLGMLRHGAFLPILARLHTVHPSVRSWSFLATAIIIPAI